LHAYRGRFTAQNRLNVPGEQRFECLSGVCFGQFLEEMAQIGIRLEPFEYLSEVFQQLPLATTVEAIEALLPWNLKPILDARRRRQEPASQIDSP
jgi:IS66 C-terminal element